MSEIVNDHIGKFPNVSVVMATLGGPSLKDTIAALNSGTVVPTEILVCIPEGFVDNVINLTFANVQIIQTKCKGQVAQRAVGFRSVRYDLVMQLDDDLVPEVNCLQNLISALDSLPANFAVAPSYMNIETGESFYKVPPRSTFLKWYYWLLNSKEGYQPGTVTLAASPVGYEFSESSPSIFRSEWLPGGCVLHRRQNLVTENFYPLPGKAFSEDLFHSQLLKKKGVEFAFVKEAVLWLHTPDDFGPSQNWQNFKKDFKARKVFVKSHPEGRSLWRMYFYYALNAVRYVWRKQA